MPAEKVNTEAKRIFAKLLATEDIMVRHDKNSSTATFDTEKRVLTLPVLTGMDNDVYDLFVGHEVGHALFTPGFSTEQMMDTLKEVCPENINLAKIVLNMTEDARIERMMRAKYPGLGKNFIRGYKNLYANGFFGDDIPQIFGDLGLIDRLNLWYKLHTYGITHFEMNEVERDFISLIDDAKTFEDIVDVSKKIIEQLKKDGMEIEEEQQQSSTQMMKMKAGGDGDAMGENGFGILPDENDGDDDENAQQNDDDGQIGSNAGLNFGKSSNSPPKSAMEKYIESKRNDDYDSENYTYNSLPTPNLSRIIVPWNAVHSKIDDIYQQVLNATGNKIVVGHISCDTQLYDPDSECRTFLNETKSAVSSMAVAFKRKQQAYVSRRISIGKTGRINMNSVHRYKYDDDIFLRTAFVPKGKNHGMIMFVDWSGSMSANIRQTVEQTINLAYFCKMVNIPFRVYAFSDCMFYNPEAYTEGESCWKEYDKSGNTEDIYSRNFDAQDSHGNPYCRLSRFHLHEFLSSEMNTNQFNNSVKNMLFITNLIVGRLNAYVSNPFGLNGTPLNECVVASIDIVKKFREQYNIQIMNTIFLTDGESGGMPIVADRTSYWARSANNVIVSYKNKPYDISAKNQKFGFGQPNTNGFLNILAEEANTRVIGFFLASQYGGTSFIHNGYMTSRIEGNNTTKISEKTKKYRNDSFVVCDHDGYDTFYVMQAKASAMTLEDVFENVDETKETKNIISSFVKSANSRGKSRILLNNFAEIVAQDLN